MDNGRNYIIDRLKSKKVTIDEFNFDKLSAPPLSLFLSPQDIWELNSIAKSIKYSGKLKEKLQMIDTICKRRGLVKFASGTNRVIYRHPEFNTIVFKIAYDNVALMDNINEFKNQYILKPFVAKTFEVSPCGTVAISERVQPIRSREEFISIADDVFTLLNEFIIGRYIMEDIGSTKFMNYGCRTTNNFGPVLLDYSFLYELDENKIYCNKPDPTSPTGFCEGEIVYDDGFNHLYCEKCGARYKAIELKKKIKDNDVIVRRKGETKMKVVVRGGSLKSREVIDTSSSNNNFKETVDSIISSTKELETRSNSSNKVVVNLKGNSVKREEKPAVPVVKVQAPVRKKDIIEDEVAVNGVKVVASVKDIPEVKTEEPKVEEVEKTSIEDFIASLPEEEDKEVELESPISINESLIGEVEHFAGKNPVELIDDAVNSIIENLNAISIDAVKEDAINRMIDKIVNNIPANGNAFKNVIEIAVSIFDNAEDEDYIDVIHSEKFINFIKRVFDPMVVNANVDRDGNDIVIDQYVDMCYAYDTTDKAYSTLVNSFRLSDIPELVYSSNSVVTEKEIEEERDLDEGYNGIQFANGAIVNAKEIFSSADNEEIIVGIDESGDYVTDKFGNIIGLNIINDCEVNSVTLVSKDWVNSVAKILESAEAEKEEAQDFSDDVVPTSEFA